MSTHENQNLSTSVLGKKTTYQAYYNPDLLYPILRAPKRIEIGVYDSLPFFGYDLWNHYEVSWLNEKGKPEVAIASLIYDCASTHIIESKSMKLYFNSLNNSKFKDKHAVQALIENDIKKHTGSPQVTVTLNLLQDLKEQTLFPRLDGICIDALDIHIDTYHANPQFLRTTDKVVEETLCSDLLKSNCLVTNQPDWCSVQISYKGRQIDRAGLLRYLVSFRNDNEFHEQCIEKIFMEIIAYCHPSELTIQGRSTRRGGLDINSYRSTKQGAMPVNKRLSRQ